MHAQVASGGARLLERESELTLIEDRIGAATQARGSLLLIEGPAGIGKTELVDAARERAVAAGMEVLTARGGELERSLGLGIVRQLFEARLAASTPAERRELLADAASLAASALGSELVTHSPAPPSSPLGNPAASVHHGLYWLTANLAEGSPLLLSIDDLQWGDPSSVRWLIYLARRLADLRVLVVAAWRDGEPGVDPVLLAALRSEAEGGVVRPAELSDTAGSELIRRQLGDEAEPSFCAACHRVTGGNPFLLSELIDAIGADGIPPVAASIQRIEELGPEAIWISIMLRLARLPAGAEPLARSVAILGSEAEPRRATALAGLDQSTAAEVADALRAASILAAGRPLRFAHPLIRTAAYDQIPEAERALGHARAARALSDDGAPFDEVAAQLLQAEPAAQAWVVEALRVAASDAIARGTPDAAVGYLRRGLQEPPSTELRTDLIRDLLDAGVRAADVSVFEGISEDPVGELTRDPASTLASARLLGPWLAATVSLDEATELAKRAIVIANEAGDHRLAIQLELQLLSVVQIRPDEALDRLERYADRIEPGTPEERTWLAMRAWWCHFAGGPASESAQLARRALDGGLLLQEQPETPLVGQLILVLLRADQLDEAELWIERVLDHARQRGSITSFIGAGSTIAQLAHQRGDVAAASAEARTHLEMSRDHGLTIVGPLYSAWLVDALVERAELAEADRQLAAGGLAGELPDHYWVTPVRFSRARLRLAQGRTQEALEDLRALLRFTNDTWPAIYPIASTIALASRDQDPKEARRLAEWEMERAREWDTPRAIGVALRALGLIEGGERGIELLREAALTLGSSPARLEQARALSDLGGALRRANHRSEAREVLKQAVEAASRCGAVAIERQAREELAATGAKPRRVMLSGVESLTPSELRVARMAAQGMENKEIAQALFVTPKTVETHLGHAYRKLDISSRKDLPEALR